MKSMKNIKSEVAKIVGLCVVAGTLGFSQSQAADIKFQVKVPGYTQRGDGWVLVLPELRSVLGGAVRWDSARNSYITDRVARGEVMKITISPGTRSEQCTRIALVGIAPGDTWYFDRLVLLPYVINGFVVSKNPAYDNVYVNVYTTSGHFDKRIPIGTR
jgi:hypothetical protein